MVSQASESNMSFISAIDMMNEVDLELIDQMKQSQSQTLEVNEVA